MCGIAGIATLGGSKLPTEQQLRSMCSTIVHRGPDDEGIFVHNRVGLAMRRLSIIDIAGGHQPIFNEDKSICTVFNGEIYNYRELRDELTARGHCFSSASDTEVIVHAYEEYGIDFPNHLNGMFSIAVYDSRRQILLLTRDHIGIKPFYYSYTTEFLVWGSEIKTILASGLVDRDIDLDAVGQFMSWEYVPGEQTLLSTIRKLEPGMTLEIDIAHPRCSPVRYWDIPNRVGDRAISASDWADIVDEKLRQCVRRQLVSDVPLGAFLSGGVDSSLIVAAMGNAKTFSIGFDDPSYNELDHSKRVAEHLGVDHLTEVIDSNVVGLFDKLMYYMDDPIGDFSIFPTYLVSRLTRSQVKVVLSGDGGDELFGGYETYVADQRCQQFERVPRALRRATIDRVIDSLRPRPGKKGLINKAKRFVEGSRLPASLGHSRWRLFADEALRNALFTPGAREHMISPVAQHIEKLYEMAGNRGRLDQHLYVDVKSYLSDNILTKVDRMSMAVSLESRVPFLDREMVELAFQVPENMKVSGNQTKVLLKKVAARHVPRECVYRQKEGFSIPIKNWLKTQFRPLMDEMLDTRRIQNGGIFNPKTVTELKDEHLSGKANNSHALWSLIVFEAWRDKWLNDPQATKPGPDAQRRPAMSLNT